MLLTAQLLLDYQRCNRRAFLDVYADRRQQDPPSDYLLKLIRDSLTYQNAVLAERSYHKPHYPRRDWKAGAEETLALMRCGVDCIHQGVLLMPMSDSVTLLSIPDLLIKEPGESDFGNWTYLPTTIKLGRRPKLDYQIVAAFHARVLASVQGIMPETARLILRQQKYYAVNLPVVLPQLREILNNCIEMLRSPSEPEVFISRQRCHLCKWLSSCHNVAESEGHLSLIAGVTPVRYQYLQALEITTVDALAGADPAAMVPELEETVARQLVRQAQATLEKRAIAKSSPTAEDLLVSPVELYFDIEAEPEQNLEYLLGVLVVDRLAQTERFYGFVAEHPSQEESIWQQFLQLTRRYPNAPIFHFCEYEVKTAKRLAKLYNTPASEWKPVLARFADIHERVTRLVTLPVSGYALKSIARWIGFEWRDPNANGAQSICWYERWLKTGDRASLEAIVRYNEDDCRATHRVKDWLTEFFLTSSPPF